MCQKQDNDHSAVGKPFNQCKWQKNKGVNTIYPQLDQSKYIYRTKEKNVKY